MKRSIILVLAGAILMFFSADSSTVFTIGIILIAIGLFIFCFNSEQKRYNELLSGGDKGDKAE